MSLPPRTLTRAQFENACKKYIDSDSSPLLAHSPTGWEWREDPVCLAHLKKLDLDLQLVFHHRLEVVWLTCIVT